MESEHLNRNRGSNNYYKLLLQRLLLQSPQVAITGPPFSLQFKIYNSARTLNDVLFATLRLTFLITKNTHYSYNHVNN